MRPTTNSVTPPTRPPLVLRLAVWSLTGLVIVVGALNRLDALTDRAAAPPPAPERMEDATLYRALVDLKLITPGADSTIILPSRDHFLIDLARHQPQDLESLRQDTAWKTGAALVEALYTTRTGDTVRHQVALWNHSRGFLALRDNRPPSPGQTSQPGPILTGDRPSQWTASDEDAAPIPAIDLFVPEAFRYVAPIAEPGFGDWASFARTARSLRLTSDLTLTRPASPTIQIIGHLDTSLSSLPAGAIVTPRCPKAPCNADTAPAALVTLPELPAGTHRISLVVAPLAQNSLPIPELALEANPADPALPVWHGIAIEAPGETIAPPPPLTLQSADGHTLWQAGRASREALAAGLLPLLGFGREDGQGLAGILSHPRPTPPTAPVTLAASQTATTLIATTIDLQVQAAAEEALTATLSTLIPANDPFADRRRAALVVLDPDTGAILASAGYPSAPAALNSWDYAAGRATDHRRDPLELVGWQGRSVEHAPGSTFKPVVSLAALAEAETNPAIAAMIAGCGLTGDSLTCAGLPGSAGSYAMPGQQTRISNFRRPTGHVETIADGFGKPRRDNACLAAEQPTDQPTPENNGTHSFGLPEAIRDSLNVWFVRMAEQLDHEPAAAYDAAARHRQSLTPDSLPDLAGSHLIDMATRLGFFDDTLDLAAGARVWLGNAGHPGDVLHPEAAQSDLRDLEIADRKPRRSSGAVDALAETAIGQRVQVLPLNLARMAAAIVSGHSVTPYLLTAWNGTPIPPQPGAALPGNLDLLRQGMKMVTENGTAAQAFDANPALRQARCAVYGKTGTAEIPVAPEPAPAPASTGAVTPNPAPPPPGAHQTMLHVNTAWFTGWADAPAFTALGGTAGPRWHRRIAFACFMSYVYGDARFGGATCAPAVASLLQNLANPDPIPQSTDIPAPAIATQTAPEKATHS